VIKVKITANFEANLADIESFWRDIGAPNAYEQLLDDLASTVVENLERHPRMGRDFLARSVDSVEASSLVARIKHRLGRGEVREYLSGDYLILYALIQDSVYLLSVRHCRQLSFNFSRL
jgi:plasmid stabilization system protein ParE